MRVTREREREVVVATSSRYCRHQLHRLARNARIEGKRRGEARRMRAERTQALARDPRAEEGRRKGRGLAGEKDKWYSSRSSSSARQRPDTDGPTPKDRDVWMFERRSAVSALELPSILPVRPLPPRPSPALLFASVPISRGTDLPGGSNLFQIDE